jgi:cytochrome P450
VVTELRRHYDVLTVGFGSLPVPLPGSAYTRAKKALERILAVFAEAVKTHRAQPREDGVSFILAHRTPEGEAITDFECATELHHIVVAGFIVFGELASILLQLERSPEVRQRLIEEVNAAAKTGPLTIEGLYRMDYLNRFTMEVKRVTPIVPVAFGRARRSFELGGYTIPEGWMVLWTPNASQLTDNYTDAQRFDPDRFAEGRGEQARHPHAFTPQGAGPATGHRCAGLDLTTYLMQVFTVVLLRSYAVRLTPGQNLDYDWSKVTPEPKDGLRAKVVKAG